MSSTFAPVPAPAVLADQAHPQNPQNLDRSEVPEVAAPSIPESAESAEPAEPAAPELDLQSPPTLNPPDMAAVAVSDAAPELDPAAQAVDPVAAPVTPAKADLNPAACAQQLKQLFPALFAGAPRPLKLRIQVDIQERSPGLFTKPVLTAFFRRYTGSTAYLIAVSRAKQRFDLDGLPSGELSEEHREVALAELARRRANTESRVALEDQQRRNRATLLHDFGQTTLTPANFCALKGIAEGELEGYLATARREAEERVQQPAFEPRRPAGRPQPHQRRR